ncbi:hypothetical protein [Streptomyces orinoci]|uniref:Uncharacterized protein n=1 Tax=Streptomyces orinoci TaxID=67339 RepID=A0ABV3JRW6_STRON|nr:hypothetical protein [Streptomyces orinoci]
MSEIGFPQSERVLAEGVSLRLSAFKRIADSTVYGRFECQSWRDSGPCCTAWKLLAEFVKDFLGRLDELLRLG